MEALIDIGVNLASDAFADDLEPVLERAAAAGVTAMIATGTSEAVSAQVVALARRFPGRVYATAGVHPHHARETGAETLSVLRQLAADRRVVAIGETGLDFNRDFSPRPRQEAVFEAQLELAVELGLPVFLHERDAQARLLAILRTYRDRLPRAVIHCFTSGREQLWPYLDLDLHVGITGWLCDERRGEPLRQCVADIPRDRLMIETDAPYLLPRDLRPKPRNGRNEPAFLPQVLARLALCRQEPEDALARSTTATARAFFGLDAAEARPR